ncbi:MAG TPA: GGDEF domain-containing protein [Pirellulaceae bacterium]|nr:GGDEF domain-containing protein [Pirellulaceae bacterium]
MVEFMLALAIVNLALGYAAAMALVEPPLWSGWVQGWRDRWPLAASEVAVLQAAESPRAGEAVKDLSDVPVPTAVAVGLDDLPPDWLSQLAAEGIVAQTFVEAVAHVLRLEVGRYREQLVAAEVRTRASADDRDAESLRRLIDELRYVNQDWLDKQMAAADMLAQRAGRLGDHEQAAAALEQVLLDQAAQIRTACGTLQSLDAASEAENCGKQLLEQITTLLIHAHALRDGMLDLLATMIRAGKALDGLGAMVQRDVATSLPNRIGLETLLAAWWHEDEQRTRLLSAILIDVDRFGRVNQRLGTRSGDRAVITIGRLIEETLAKDRGFERLVRIGGEAFLVLQGDVGPHQALTAAERLRQAIEATTFDDEGNEFDLTISCGVIEVGHTESSLDLVRRAFEALRFAKKAGRNRCALDKGDGPAMIDPPQFPVKGRAVSLRAATLGFLGAAPAFTVGDQFASNQVAPPSE